MGALKSFVLTRKGIVYFLTVLAATYVYARGEIGADVYLAIIGAGGGIFQITTAWEDSAEKSAGSSSGKVKMEFETESSPAPSEDRSA